MYRTSRKENTAKKKEEAFRSVQNSHPRPFQRDLPFAVFLAQGLKTLREYPMKRGICFSQPHIQAASYDLGRERPLLPVRSRSEYSRELPFPAVPILSRLDSLLAVFEDGRLTHTALVGLILVVSRGILLVSQGYATNDSVSVPRELDCLQTRARSM